MTRRRDRFLLHMGPAEAAELEAEIDQAKRRLLKAARTRGGDGSRELLRTFAVMMVDVVIEELVDEGALSLDGDVISLVDQPPD